MAGVVGWIATEVTSRLAIPVLEAAHVAPPLVDLSTPPRWVAA